jgi:hypothetical protein
MAETSQPDFLLMVMMASKKQALQELQRHLLHNFEFVFQSISSEIEYSFDPDLQAQHHERLLRAP